jgi:hypothetical protein
MIQKLTLMADHMGNLSIGRVEIISRINQLVAASPLQAGGLHCPSLDLWMLGGAVVWLAIFGWRFLAWQVGWEWIGITCLVAWK